MAGERVNTLRAPGAEAKRVSFFELFFDLVYVFSITQISQALLEQLGLRGAGLSLILLLAVWWAWVYTTWATNWINPDNRLVRLVLIGIMAAALVMAAALPDAFGDRGLIFALAYTAIQVGRSSFVLWAVRDDPVRRSNFQRIVVWNAAACAVWIAGGLVGGTAREAIWIAALIVDYAAPVARFRTPGLGSSRTEEWNVTASYFSERFKLFVILALGESILVTGISLSGIEVTTSVALAFGVAFVGSVAMWWIYFDRSAEAASEILKRSADPGRLARMAYTYAHLPIVAGIIVSAVADELIISHSGGLANPAMVVVTLSGPALFLAGHALFKWAMFRVISVPRLLAIGALAALAPVGPMISPLLLGTLAVLVVVGVAVADTLREPSIRDTGGIGP